MTNEHGDTSLEPALNRTETASLDKEAASEVKVLVLRDYCTRSKGSGCERCSLACPHAAISYTDKGLPIKEIRYMSETGMSNMDIIVAATKNAAFVCDLAGEIGTIEAGKKADFIVVNGDPLSDINALLNLEMVVHGGIEVN